MQSFYMLLADGITTTDQYDTFNGFTSLHDALLDSSDEYCNLNPTAQCFTSHYVWAILHEQATGNSSIDFDDLTDSVYNSKITSAEMRDVDFEYCYFELDPSTTDVRISDEFDKEICVVNITQMLTDGIIDSPHMAAIHDGLVRLGHIEDEDVLVIKAE